MDTPPPSHTVSTPDGDAERDQGDDAPPRPLGGGGGGQKIGTPRGGWGSGLELVQERAGSRPRVSWSHVSQQLVECPGLREPLVTFECHFFWFQVETQLDWAMMPPSGRGPCSRPAGTRTPGLSPWPGRHGEVKWLARAWRPAHLGVVSEELLHPCKPQCLPL